jgi:hypothetical protein
MGFERGAILRLLLHPVLLGEAVRSWLAMRRRGGWGVASPYMSWRTLTAYGDYATTVSAQDLLSFLAWRREMRSIRKWGREP